MQFIGDPGGTIRVEHELERYRPELTGYRSQMLGSPFDAEDAVQDTLVRAWRGLDRLERRARLRSWLYTIATNVCIRHAQGAGAAGGDPR